MVAAMFIVQAIEIVWHGPRERELWPSAHQSKWLCELQQSTLLISAQVSSLTSC